MFQAHAPLTILYSMKRESMLAAQEYQHGLPVSIFHAFCGTPILFYDLIIICTSPTCYEIDIE